MNRIMFYEIQKFGKSLGILFSKGTLSYSECLYALHDTLYVMKHRHDITSDEFNAIFNHYHNYLIGINDFINRS